MITYRFRSRTDEGMQTITTSRPGVWVDVDHMTERDSSTLVAAHALDEGVLADAQDFFEVPRFEHESGISHFFTRYPTSTTIDVDGDASTAPILIAVGPDFVLTSVINRPQFLDKLVQSSDVYTTQKTKFFLQIISAITQEYSRMFGAIRKEVHRNRMNVRDVSERSIEQLVHLEYMLNEFVTALVPTNEALQRLLAGSYLQFYDADLDLLEDVQLANSQLIEGAKSSLKTIQNVRSAHAALVSNRLNKVVKTLTALTMLFTIPMVVASLYGMNVALPLGSYTHAFTVIIVVIVGLVGIGVYIFRKNDWI